MRYQSISCKIVSVPKLLQENKWTPYGVRKWTQLHRRVKSLHEGMWLHTYKKGKIVFEGLPAWKWLLYELQELGWTQHTIKEQQW